MKSVLITGCSKGGIGYGYVLEFHKRNYHVFATARDLSTLSDLQKLPNITLIQLDITDSIAIDNAARTVREVMGGTLDVLINNASIMRVKPLLELPIEEGKRVFDTNVWGTIAVTQAFAPMLIAAKGCVVNATTMVGMMDFPWFSMCYWIAQGCQLVR